MSRGNVTNSLNATAEVLCPSGVSFGDGQCFCDWRVQLTGCPKEESFLRILYLINTIACFVVFIMITGLLIWRTTVRGQRLIAKDPLKEMGYFRPRPLECFLLLNMLHVCSRLLYSVCLLSQYLTSNTLLELFHDVTFTISLASLAVYLIGLIYTVPRSHITRYRHHSHSSNEAKIIWIPRPAIVDSFGFFVLIGPIVSLNTFAIISGMYMDNADVEKAEIWITVHYLSWSFFCWIIMIGLVYFGSRLTNVIVTHIEDTKYSGRATPMKIQNLERGLNKLRIISYFCCSLGFDCSYDERYYCYYFGI
ncbi:hypothetical protein C2G38_53672 [Gigaspora rosea]|uniref:Uncharacterized protein n=1 Tax=Gigaspora rosea TaxID=44941 RepID=A0A397URS5_9GLOM|nr:hypothetical protein C2G38_53672 [Gigaspora rosea]